MEGEERRRREEDEKVRAAAEEGAADAVARERVWSAVRKLIVVVQEAAAEDEMKLRGQPAIRFRNRQVEIVFLNPHWCALPIRRHLRYNPRRR